MARGLYSNAGSPQHGLGFSVEGEGFRVQGFNAVCRHNTVSEPFFFLDFHGAVNYGIL